MKKEKTKKSSTKKNTSTKKNSAKKTIQKKTVKKRSKTNVAYGICMTFITIVFVASLLAQYQVKLDLNAQEKEVKTQLSQQEKIKKRLTNEADNQDSPEVVEKIAREKLNMVKPNEIVFIDENQNEKATSNPLTTTQSSVSDGE